MVTYTVLAYSVDSTGHAYGEPKPKHVWTKELMEAYKGMRFVSKIFENENGKSELIWENRRG